MRILALDPAAKTGFAFSSIKDRVEASGVWNLCKDAQERPAKIAALLRRSISDHRPEVVAYEIATMGSKRPHVQRMLNELCGVIQSVARECCCDVWPFHISTWKARAIGNGRAKKPDIVRVLGYLGVRVTSQDEADACGILFAAQRGPPPESQKKQRRRAEKRIRQMPRLF